MTGVQTCALPISSKFSCSSHSGNTIEEEITSFLSSCNQSSGKTVFPSLYLELNGSYQQIFCNKKRPWVIVLKGTLNQIRSREIYINLDISDDLASAWDLASLNSAIVAKLKLGFLLLLKVFTLRVEALPPLLVLAP